MHSKVLLNNHYLLVNGSFVGKPVTGTQRFAIEISKELLAASASVKVILPSHVEVPDWIPSAKVFRVPQLGRSKIFRQFSELVIAPILIGIFCKQTAVWSPCNIGFPFYHRHIVTIHDMSIRHNPGWFDWKFVWTYRILFRLFAWTKTKITTVSEFSRSEITRYYGIPASRITLTPNGVSSVFPPPFDPPPAANSEIQPILSVASKDPRKRVQLVIDAWSALPETLRELHPLYLVGGGSHVFGKTEYQAREGVTNLGRISDERLAELYSRARVVVLASEYEGFGLPIVEALACGAKVLCSDIPPFREVGGEWVQYFDSKTSEGLKAALVEAIDSGPPRREFRLQSDWKYSAEQILAIVETFKEVS